MSRKGKFAAEATGGDGGGHGVRGQTGNACLRDERGADAGAEKAGVMVDGRRGLETGVGIGGERRRGQGGREGKEKPWWCWGRALKAEEGRETRADKAGRRRE